MYTIKETLKPIADKYDEFLNGPYLTNLLKFKGQQEVGADYISKVFRAKGQEIRSRYDNAVQEVQNPTYTGFIKDNFFRIFALNGTSSNIQSCRKIDRRLSSCSIFEQNQQTKQFELLVHRDYE